MKSAYINDYQIHSNTSNPNGIYLHAPLEGLEFPELRLSSYNRPGEHGGFVSNNLYGGRRITLQGSIFAENRLTYETKRREFIEQLAIVKNSANSVTPAVLKLTTMDDLMIQVEVHLKEYSMKNENALASRFFLDLYAPDFFLTSQSEYTTTIQVESGGGVVYPVVYPAVYGASVGGTEIVTNGGTAESYPIITINGPVINPIIENTTVDRYIELDQTLLSGESIVIDMKNRTILKGTTSVIGSKSDASRFWYLAAGANIIRFLTDNSTDTGNVQITHKYSYLGI